MPRLGLVPSLDNQDIGLLHRTTAIVVRDSDESRYGRATVYSLAEPGAVQIAPGVALVYGPGGTETVAALSKPTHATVILVVGKKPKGTLAKVVRGAKAAGRTVHVEVLAGGDDIRGLDLHAGPAGPELVLVGRKGLHNRFIERQAPPRRRSRRAPTAIPDPEPEAPAAEVAPEPAPAPEPPKPVDPPADPAPAEG